MMSELKEAFQTLPEEYQNVIRMAEEKHKIKITPLQLITGGFSGAAVYLASVTSNGNPGAEHLILKLDHKSRHAKNDEWTRHKILTGKASPNFTQNHIAELAFERVESENAAAIFYRIAGQSLLNFQPLSKFNQQNQLETIFTETNDVLLSKWNTALKVSQALHPREVLGKWLGFRLGPGRPIEEFIKEQCHIDPEVPGFLISGNVFPNPLFYARSSSAWDNMRPIDVASGQIHGDLNTNNILVKFSENEEDLEGYYLIDFALFKEDMPLFYDQRYVEMSYLLQLLSQMPFGKVVDGIISMGDGEPLTTKAVGVELAGVSEVIRSFRLAFSKWVDKAYPSLQDDLWGQYWLAGVAAGLGYTHKGALPPGQRMAGLIYAAVNLKHFLTDFKLPLPNDVVLLYDENQSANHVTAKTKNRPSHALPAQQTPFIGRETEITEIIDLLKDPDTRLVTLLGAGGAGKTRISLQAARKVAEDFKDGIVFVPLAEDTDQNQMISRIAKQLNVREGGRPLLESVKDYLSDKQMLLILDNFEQLVFAAATAAEILNFAPSVKIIATSRIALNLHGEQIFPVPPMKLPGLNAEPELAYMAENESINLFVKRAQANRPDFRLTKENASDIVKICHRLDGLPLAIELAAAKIKFLTPQAILSRLDQKLKLLSGGARDLPVRHQTLRNTLEWSFNLLSQDEKTLYARLSVFSGGFTLDAVESVCNMDEELDTMQSLSSLVDNSLIYQMGSFDGTPRFGMLETIREYALDRLEKSGDLETYSESHARYFGEIVINQVGDEIFTSKAVYWVDWVERELDNVRSTLSWSLTKEGDINLGAMVVMALIWFWYRRGYLLEGLMWSERMLEHPAMKVPSPARAFVLHSGGLLAIWTGQQEKGLARIEESLAILKRAEEDRWIAFSMMSNAVALLNMGKDHDARPLLEQAQRIFKEIGQDYFNAITLVHLGNVELGLGNAEKAQAILEEAKTLALRLDENWILSFVVNNLGEVARTRGQFDLARGYYEQCQSLLATTGDNGDMARFVHSLGYIAQHEGDFESAESKFREGLMMFRRLGNRRGIAECLAGLAGIKARQGYANWGAVVLGAAERLLHSTGGAWWPADRVEVERNLELLQSSLDEIGFISAWNKGRDMTIDQAIEFSSNEP
jgi:predicted ATPase